MTNIAASVMFSVLLSGFGINLLFLVFYIVFVVIIMHEIESSAMDNPHLTGGPPPFSKTHICVDYNNVVTYS